MLELKYVELGYENDEQGSTIPSMFWHWLKCIKKKWYCPK